jgi:hypothetical protein
MFLRISFLFAVLRLSAEKKSQRQHSTVFAQRKKNERIGDAQTNIRCASPIVIEFVY